MEEPRKRKPGSHPELLQNQSEAVQKAQKQFEDIQKKRESEAEQNKNPTIFKEFMSNLAF